MNISSHLFEELNLKNEKAIAFFSQRQSNKKAEKSSLFLFSTRFLGIFKFIHSLNFDFSKFVKTFNQGEMISTSSGLIWQDF